MYAKLCHDITYACETFVGKFLPEFDRCRIPFGEHFKSISAFLFDMFAILFDFFSDPYVDLQEVIDRITLKCRLVSEILPSCDQLAENTTPVSLMHVAQNCVSLLSQDIDCCLSEEWRTEMSYMERLADIGTYIVDDDGL